MKQSLAKLRKLTSINKQNKHTELFQPNPQRQPASACLNNLQPWLQVYYNNYSNVLFEGSNPGKVIYVRLQQIILHKNLIKKQGEADYAFNGFSLLTKSG